MPRRAGWHTVAATMKVALERFYETAQESKS